MLKTKKSFVEKQGVNDHDSCAEDDENISYIENGRKKLSLETLVNIANTLQVSADELLSYNIEYRCEIKDEYSSILEKCSTYEKKVITDMARALKQSLRDERTSKTFY